MQNSITFNTHGKNSNSAFQIKKASNTLFFNYYSGSISPTPLVSLLSSGNVGIGTTSPQTKLHIVSTGAPNGITLEPSSGTESPEIRFVTSTNHYNIDNNAGTLRFFTETGYGTGGVVRAVIDSSGNVGIGTTSPSYKLSIVGSNPRTFIQDSSTGYPILQLNNASGNFYFAIDNSAGSGFGSAYARYIYSEGAYPIILVTNSTARMTISSAGALRLHAYGSGTNTGTVAYNLAVDSSGNVIETAGGVVDGSGTANYIPKWQDANTLTNSVIYDNSGNIGIGTTNPGTKLQVVGTTKSNQFSTTAGNYNGYGFWDGVGGNDYSIWMADSATAGGQLTGDTSGNDYNMYFKMNYSNRGFIFITGDNTSHFQITNEGAFVKGNIKLTSTAGQTSTPSYIWLGNDFSNGTTRDKLKVYLYNSGTEQYGFGVGSSGDIQYHSNTIHDFYINNSFSTRINSTGLAVGTTSAPGNRLIVAQDTGYTNENTYTIAAAASTNTAYKLIMGYDYSQDIGVISAVQTGVAWKGLSIAPNGGNVGIGTTAAAAKLDVNGGSLTLGSESSYALRVRNGSGKTVTLGADSSYAYIQSFGSGPLQINNQGNNVLFNVNGGSVGIGTTNPSQTLHVAGNLRVTGAIYDSNNEAGSSGQILSSTGTGTDWVSLSSISGVDGTGTANYVPKWTDADTIGNSQIFDNGTNVGIGTTSPTAKLTIGSNASVLSTNGIALGAGQTSLEFVHATFQNGFGSKLYSVDSGGGITSLRIATRPDSTSWSDAVTIIAGTTGNGNVGIGTTSPGAKLEVVGTFRATTKSFLIDHPTKPTKKLQYGVLEGPEHSVYVRGKLTGTRRIELPDYWHALIHEDSITVNLTAIGRGQQLWVEEITDTYITVRSESGIVNCFYTVFAERKDVDKLITEFDKE